MGNLNRDSRQSIFFSVGYTIASEWPSDTMHRLDFQKALAENQLDFPQTSVGVRDFTLVRKEPSALQVQIASVGPRVSSVMVSSDRPAHSLEYFCKEADVVCNAYREMFIKKECQILRCGVTIRHLYSCEDHAFKYLWEERLGQKPEDFSYLGRPVLGGGLRLVMPPTQDSAEPVQIEIKMESFFRESRKMFIETAFVWPRPRLLQKDAKFEPAIRLTEVEKYAQGKVWDFISIPQ